MLATTCWMVHGNTWCLLDGLGYFLLVTCWYFLPVSGCVLVVPGGVWLVASYFWWCLARCWQFPVMDCARVLQFNVLVPLGDEQLGH